MRAHPRFTSSARRLSVHGVGLLLAILAVMLAQGCGQEGLGGSAEPLPSGKSEIELVGVIAVNQSSLDHFVPRRLEVVSLTAMSDAEFQQTVNEVLPGGSLRDRGFGGTEWVVEPPPGLSLEQAAARLKEDPAIGSVTPSLLDVGSTGATLYQTDTGSFVVDGPALVSLLTNQDGLLGIYNRKTIVRVTGIIDLDALPLGPEDVVEVEQVQALADHRVELTGRVWHMGEDGDCLLLAGDDGHVVELLGSKAETIRGLDWSDGAWIHLTGQDLGRSTRSCSGGRRLAVESFTLARRE